MISHFPQPAKILKSLSSGQIFVDDKIYPCAHGRSGFTAEAEKKEGDGKTPQGQYRCLKVYYRADRREPPQTRLPVVALSKEDGWCDDPTHPDYNQLVKLPFSASHENLWRKDHLYDLIVVTTHNQFPIIAGKGSAIFIHVAAENTDGTLQPTAGCLSLRAADLEALLKVTDENTIWDTAAAQ